jgi:hypothetical protein
MIPMLLVSLNIFTPQHFMGANKRQTHILDTNYKATDLKEIIKCISTIDDIEKNKLF